MSSKPFAKSGSFPIKRSSSMDGARPVPTSAATATARTLVPNRSFASSVEFPTSTQFTVLEEGKVHYTHPRHPLTLRSQLELFVCAGCKEYGSGRRFTCGQCDFQLHEFCASPPSVIKDHPLHAQHQLVFHSKPKQGGIMWPRCNICAKSIKGFTFRCKACGFQIHPCCAKLYTVMKFPCHSHALKLLPPVLTSSSSSNVEPGLVCGQCNQKRSGRVYRCTVCHDQYLLHAVCAKSMINGLHDIGVNTIDKPNNRLASAAELASKVVIEFVGALIEGVAQGVGESLVQPRKSRQPDTRKIG